MCVCVCGSVGLWVYRCVKTKTRLRSFGCLSCQAAVVDAVVVVAVVLVGIGVIGAYVVAMPFPCRQSSMCFVGGLDLPFYELLRPKTTTCCGDRRDDGNRTDGEASLWTVFAEMKEKEELWHSFRFQFLRPSLPAAVSPSCVSIALPPSFLPSFLCTLNRSYSVHSTMSSKLIESDRTDCMCQLLSSTALPATDTRLIQYRLPLLSGRLCPKCVPAVDTTSPSGRIRTLVQSTSASRKDGHP